MAKHIGILACSAEGAALCYRTICVEGAAILGPHAHPEGHGAHLLAGRLYGVHLPRQLGERGRADARIRQQAERIRRNAARGVSVGSSIGSCISSPNVFSCLCRRRQITVVLSRLL